MPKAPANPGRLAAYRALLTEVCLDPEDTRLSAADDAREWLQGERPLERCCLVTGAGEFTYTYPRFPTLADAQKAAFDHVDDTILPEVPMMIVDLDTGERIKPDFQSVSWVPMAVPKIASSEP